MRPDPLDGGPSGPAARSGVSRAGRGFVLVFVGALLFFAFVVGSDLGGAVGQSVLAFVFASAALVYLWRRIDPAARRRFRLEARQWLRPSSRG